MEKEQKPHTRKLTAWLLGIFVLLLFVVSLVLQTSNVWKDLSVQSASDTLLLYALSSLNFIAFIIFGFIFLRNIVKLSRERRALQLGSHIKTRLLVYFVAVCLLPIIAMAVFSYLFLNRALERWFTQTPENVVREVGKLQQRSRDEDALRLKDTAKMLASVLEERSLSDSDLRAIAIAGNLSRIEILSPENNTLSIYQGSLDDEQNAELQRTLATVHQGGTSEPLLQDGQGFDVVVTRTTDGRKLVLVPALRQSDSVRDIAQNALREFDLLKEKQVSVQQIGFLTLGVLTFLLIFASSWIAFYIARGITVPIKALAEAADGIAQGDLSQRVDVYAEDELALLVSTFNQMSDRLQVNSAELNESKNYIETILQTLPTGIISFDADNKIATINTAAVNILGLAENGLRGKALGDLVGEDDIYVFEKLISRARRAGHASEQTMLKRRDADAAAGMPVSLTVAALPENSGAVIVIEDLSDLIAAQRASAWQEVAQRMAHEIKNPLTPIQLSAERIARRFRGLEEREASPEDIHLTDGRSFSVIQDGTETILREVQSLKGMVDEFSRFARLPDARLEIGSVNEIISQVAVLYEDRLDKFEIRQNLAADLPDAKIDGEQLKRVFINLIENAVEAFDDEQTDKIINVTTRHEPARDIVVAEVADNGPGIKPAAIQKLFQPYFSTKGRGTGLGLAIVHRIVTEHHGKIMAVANQPQGAKFIIEIPVAG